MIKLEHKIFHKRGIVAFAIEASSEEDLKTLDLIRLIFEDRPDISLGFENSKRLLIHVRGLENKDKSIFEDF